MNYDELPKFAKSIISKQDIINRWNNDEKYFEDIEITDESNVYGVMDALENDLRPDIQRVGFDGPDDFMCNAFLDSYNNLKEGKVRIEIYGRFQCCVYECAKFGKSAYSKLANTVEAIKAVNITDTEQPENTCGIAFNGIYQNEDTVYIKGHYSYKYEIDYSSVVTK